MHIDRIIDEIMTTATIDAPRPQAERPWRVLRARSASPRRASPPAGPRLVRALPAGRFWARVSSE